MFSTGSGLAVLLMILGSLTSALAFFFEFVLDLNSSISENFLSVAFFESHSNLGIDTATAEPFQYYHIQQPKLKCKMVLPHAVIVVGQFVGEWNSHMTVRMSVPCGVLL